MKVLVRISLNVYFRRIKIVGKERVPSKGALIIVANHPSAFMDPISIATHLKRTLHFIAAGEFFGGPITTWLFRRQFYMIPVYRPDKQPKKSHENKDMFEACFKHLRAGRSILIFPEGVSVTEKNIKPFKTGAARMARGTLVGQEKPIPLYILPIGLNYSNPHQFRSNLLMKIGEPIDCNDYFNLHSEDDFEEIRTLTSIAEARLKQCVVHLDNPEDEALVEQIKLVYLPVILAEQTGERTKQEVDFRASNRIVEAIDYFRFKDPDRYNRAYDKLESYMDGLKRNNLLTSKLTQWTPTQRFLVTLQFILGAPFYLIAVLVLGIPYKLIDWANQRMTVDPSFKGSIVLASGLLIYLLWAITICILCWTITPIGPYSLLVFPVIYILGLHGLIYKSALQMYMRRSSVKEMSASQSEIYQELEDLRLELVDEFDTMRKEYEHSTDA